MILYELATDASKYSGLGSADGTLDLPRIAADLRTFGIGSGFGDLLTGHCLSKLNAQVIRTELTGAGFTFVMEFDAVTRAPPARGDPVTPQSYSSPTLRRRPLSR